MVRNLRYYLELIISLRKLKYDLCLVLRAPIRGNLLIFSKLLNPKYLIGFKEMGLNNLMDSYGSFSFHRPEIENYKSILKAIPGFRLSENKLKYNLIKTEKRIEKDKKSLIIFLNTEGESNLRSLSEKNTISIIKSIIHSSEEIKIFLNSPPGKEEKINRIVKLISNKKVKCAPTVKNYIDLHKILNMSHFVISVDTSIIHFSSIYCDNIVGIYQNDRRKVPRLNPISEKTLVLKSLEEDVNSLKLEESISQIKKFIVENS